MQIDKIKRASEFLSELDRLKEIKRHINEEDSSWWSFLTPYIISWKEDGLIMPKILREEFTKAVDKSIERLEKQIEEL
nr:hypothetical protein [Prevotella pallens]